MKRDLTVCSLCVIALIVGACGGSVQQFFVPVAILCGCAWISEALEKRPKDMRSGGDGADG